MEQLLYTLITTKKEKSSVEVTKYKLTRATLPLIKTTLLKSSSLEAKQKSFICEVLMINGDNSDYMKQQTLHMVCSENKECCMK